MWQAFKYASNFLFASFSLFMVFLLSKSCLFVLILHQKLYLHWDCLTPFWINARQTKSYPFGAVVANERHSKSHQKRERFINFVSSNQMYIYTGDENWKVLVFVKYLEYIMRTYTLGQFCPATHHQKHVKDTVYQWLPINYSTYFPLHNGVTKV